MVKIRNIFDKICDFTKINDRSICINSTKHLSKSQIEKIYSTRKVIQVIVQILEKHHKKQGFYYILTSKSRILPGKLLHSLLIFHALSHLLWRGSQF